MKVIKGLENTRWFIWAVVFIFVSLVGLAYYIYVTSEIESASLISATSKTATHHRALSSEMPVIPATETAFFNTTWVPDGEFADALIRFDKTKKNDPKHVFYDYHSASDSQMREMGFWQIKNGEIVFTITKVETYSTGAYKAVLKGNKLYIYSTDNADPYIFVKYSESF